ncbi:MAG: ribonuclease HII [Thiotrichales bacterium]|nr:ribonuclease HII [Thiotrichales bacterium]
MYADATWAGVDEVGRGPLVGSVVTAAVILPLDYDLPGLTDSKKLSEKRRELLAEQIKMQAIAWSVCEASASEVDALNVLQASLLAMRRAVEGLSIVPAGVWVDGNRCPQGLTMPCQAVVKGDLTVPAISAASILAKVARDAQMQQLHEAFPEYGFDKHKGYPTAAHLSALARLGPLSEHRKSFAPVRAMLTQSSLL